MSGILKIEIVESAETLKKKIKKEKNPRIQQRLQVIY